MKMSILKVEEIENGYRTLPDCDDDAWKRFVLIIIASYPSRFEIFENKGAKYVQFN
jgi:hypothetical protein